MAISKSEVENIAHLARLAVSEDDIASMQKDLSDILTFVDQLQSAKTDNIKPMAHPFEFHQRLREDVVTETDHRDEYQKLAKNVEDGLYLVPKVID